MNKQRAVKLIQELDIPAPAKARFRAALVGLSDGDLFCLLGGEDKEQVVATMRAYLQMRRAANGKGGPRKQAGKNGQGKMGPGKMGPGKMGRKHGEAQGAGEAGPSGIRSLAIV